MTTKRLRAVRWLLGLMVLGVSLICIGAGSTRVDAVSSASTEPVAPAEEAVACFGYVDVKHGVTSLYPTQPGRVAEVLVEENAVVKAGAVLLRLEDTVARLRVQEAHVDLEAARTQLVEVRKRPQQHQAKVAQLQAGLEALKNRLAAAKHMRRRKEDLYNKDLIVKTDLDVAGDQVKEVEALLQAEVEKQAELQLHDPAADVRRAEQEVSAKEARLRQAEESLKECGLRAPSDGKVMRVLVGPGDMLGSVPKQPVLLFCPDGPRFIRAEVEQEVAHRVKAGQPAVIRDDSNDPAVWRGRVTSLSDWYTQRRSVLQEPLQLNDVRTLECLITVDPDQTPLRIGQRVRVLIGK
jgi:multidrug resistance efflux pump